MEEVSVDNFIKFESGVYWALFQNPLRLPLNEKKERVQDLVFKINSCRGLFGLKDEINHSEIIYKPGSISENLRRLVKLDYPKKFLSSYISFIAKEVVEQRPQFNFRNFRDRYFVQIYDEINSSLNDFV